ncbi:MAG: phytase, partial [Hyphomonadaceae bacterium]|nr:phytase [Hyphomonadaceae bacterium]
MMIRALLSASFLASLAACATAPEILPFEVVSVPASVETDPMLGQGDRADDPAIWVHPTAPENSLILGTNKETGLFVYDLSGTEQAFLPVGRLNNIDLRDNLAVGSNDEVGGMSWFTIAPETLEVTHLGDTLIERVEPYGICAGMVDGIYTAGVTFKDGAIELWQATIDASGQISPSLTRTIQLGSQLEGCVFDDVAQRLFI